MSLEGNLSAFGISEILQLIAVQQKSGMLSITNPEGAARVLFFRKGDIISTRDRRRRSKDPFKDYLTRYGILSREDLIRVTQLSAQSKLDLTDILVSENLMTEDEVRTQFHSHVQESVHEVLEWAQGSYKFIPGNDVISGIKTWGEFSVEGTLMECMRRIDEFPFMLELIPDPSVVVEKIVDPDDEMELTTNDKQVLNILNKSHTVDALIAKGKLPKFEVYEAIKHLNEKDLVRITGDHVADAQEEDSKRSVVRGSRRRNIIPFLVSLAMFVGALLLAGKYALPQVRTLILERSVASEDAPITRNRTEARLRWILEAYYAEKGRYPTTISLLKKDGRLDEAFIDDLKRVNLQYRLTGNGSGYTLL
ncbi:MAG: DUF4388 domain-containing protein [bacterium]|nr:DUF4388 domain-containing protein [bacterium]